MKAYGGRSGIDPLVLSRQTWTSYFLPSHLIQPIQTALHQESCCGCHRIIRWIEFQSRFIKFSRDASGWPTTQGCTVRDTEQNSLVKWPDNGLYHSGVFSNQGQQVFSSAYDLPQTNQPSDLLDVASSFCRRSRVQLKKTKPTYYGTTHHEGPQVCY
jgi:hypothetical protein